MYKSFAHYLSSKSHTLKVPRGLTFLPPVAILMVGTFAVFLLVEAMLLASLFLQYKRWGKPKKKKR